MAVILDIAGEDVEAVDFGREIGGQDAVAGTPVIGEMPGRAGAVGGGMALEYRGI